MVEEPPLLTYSAPPSRSYSHWRDCLDWDGTRKRLLADGKLTQEESDLFQMSFGHLGKGMGYENRPCPEGLGGQTMIGASRTAPTPQDRLPITARSSADWISVNETFQSQGQHIVALSFIMDGMLSFLPLTHGRLFFNDASDCSSLDFAFRLYTPHININNWHLRECITHSGAAGRTYSEGRLWDESGNLVASMTQQSILRVPKEKGKM
jgi:acyl-CoA thioesterase